MVNETLAIEKLVNGGQGLATMPDGRKAFVWNALPGEDVKARIIKKRKDYVEAIAEEIVKPSAERIEPRDENYLSTSPWQIMTYEAENKYKHQIVQEIFAREHITLPKFTYKTPEQEWHYRNKMEYSFWGDEAGLHLALHRRGTHGKQIVTGSELAMPAVDEGANAVLNILSKHNVRAGDLKTVIVRVSKSGQIAASLFVKHDQFVELTLPEKVQGLRVYYSNPKSPASVPTKLLYELGNVELTDTLLNKEFQYDVDSFFQVNVPIFETALKQIKDQVKSRQVVDMYGGVGSIGLSVSEDPVIVEADDATVAMARRNTDDTNVVQASTEKALEYIVSDKILIVDPPRSGLHKDVVARILEVTPEIVAYLSCNPATQARDIALLQDRYKISFFEGYNFFTRTPHIETLAILRIR